MIEDPPEGLPDRYRHPRHRTPVRMRWWEALASLLCVALFAVVVYAVVFGPFKKPW